MLMTADRHGAHRSELIEGREILKRVLVGVRAEVLVEHQGVHVNDGVDAPAVVGPCAPVGVVERCAAPRDRAVAGLREGDDLVFDRLVHDLSHMRINEMPDRAVAVLGIVYAVERLGDAVDRVVGRVCGDIPFFMLEIGELVEALRMLLVLFPVERMAGLLLDELPTLLDLLLAVLLDQRIVEAHRLRHRKERAVQEPVLDDGGRHGAVAGLVGGDHDRAVIRVVIQNEDAGLGLAHRAGIRREADGLHRIDVV